MTTFKITKERPFSRENDYESFSLVRVWNELIPQLSSRWVEIKNLDNGKTVYRMAKGVGKVNGHFPKEAIELDQNTALGELEIKPSCKDENGFYKCNLSIKQATPWQRLIALGSHPDPAYRYPMQIALISLFVGILGFISGVASLLVSLF